MRTFYATMLRNWKSTLRAYAWSFFISVLMTAAYTIGVSYFTYHVLAGSQVGAEFSALASTTDYISYVVVGSAIYLLSVRMLLGISRSWITEHREGVLEVLVLATSSPFAYFLGVTAQALLTALLEMAVLVMLAFPLGLNLTGIQPVTLLLVLPVALMGLLGMGLALGAFMLRTRDTYISQNTVFATMALLCGFSFPPEYLPLPMQWLGSIFPVKGTVMLLRAALIGGAEWRDVLAPSVGYALLALIYIIAGMALMQKAARHALEGTS